MDLLKSSPFVGKDISHEDFVYGIKNNSFTIDYEFKEINVYELCSSKKKNSLAVIHIVCSILPSLLSVIFSIIYSNWWLLLGVGVSYLGIIFTHSFGYKLSAYVLVVLIGIWITKGFHFSSLITFLPLIFVLSQMLTGIENEYDKMYLIDALVKSPRLFYEYVDKITILKVEK